MATTTLTFEMDSGVKSEAESLFAEMGMDLETAVNIFVRQVIRERRIPFTIRVE